MASRMKMKKEWRLSTFRNAESTTLLGAVACRHHVIAPSPWDFNIANKAIRNNRNSPRDPTLPLYTTIYHDPSCINVAHLPFPLVPLVPLLPLVPLVGPWCFPLPSIGDPIVLQMMVTTKHPAPAIQTYEWLMPHHGGHTGPKVLRMIDLLWLVYACRVEHVNLSIWSIQMNLIKSLLSNPNSIKSSKIQSVYLYLSVSFSRSPSGF